MPAKNLSRINEEGVYSYVYNKRVEKGSIINDTEDYNVFIGYLKDSLTAPQNRENTKKDFVVKGHTFRGTPHLPKNFFGKIELIAYSLRPDCYHLVLHLLAKGSLESFVRSICTRYSIYFNKKYQHTGALFEGPYKSTHITDEPSLLQLTRCLHHNEGYSSFAEYLGTRATSWVNPNVVLSYFGKGTNAYKDFVENYELDQKEKTFFGEAIIKEQAQPLERRDLTSNENVLPNPRLITQTWNPKFLALTTIVFLVLLIIGIRNIIASEKPMTKSSIQASVPVPAPVPAVLSQTTSVEEAKPKTTVTIKTEDKLTQVNIRQKPMINSKKIGNAKNGDIFEFVSLNSGWYGVKLTDGLTGYISATYITTNKQ